MVTAPLAGTLAVPAGRFAAAMTVSAVLWSVRTTTAKYFAGLATESWLDGLSWIGLAMLAVLAIASSPSGGAPPLYPRMGVASGGMAGDDSRMTKVLTREIRESDVKTVVRMVHDLAAYEKSSDECRMTVEQLREALFCATPALFGHVAEVEDRVVGFVLWFLNFSTWTGTHGVYGEDMYVEPEYRGHGAGRALFEAMARVCVERGYQRLEFWTLDWNTGTIAFTTSLGAKPMDEWTVYRISGTELAELGDARAG